MPKKLLLILTPLPVWFFLSLAFGSAGEPPDLCHLCRKKALVRQVIEAQGSQWESVEGLYDPNYIHHDLTWPLHVFSQFSVHFYSVNPELIPEVETIVEHIIAEGDKVSVCFLWWNVDRGRHDVGYVDGDDWPFYTEMWIFRIANGKLVEGWSLSERQTPLDELEQMFDFEYLVEGSSL